MRKSIPSRHSRILVHPPQRINLYKRILNANRKKRSKRSSATPCAFGYLALQRIVMFRYRKFVLEFSIRLYDGATYTFLCCIHGVGYQQCPPLFLSLALLLSLSSSLTLSSPLPCSPFPYLSLSLALFLSFSLSPPFQTKSRAGNEYLYTNENWNNCFHSVAAKRQHYYLRVDLNCSHIAHIMCATNLHRRRRPALIEWRNK